MVVVLSVVIEVGLKFYEGIIYKITVVLWGYVAIDFLVCSTYFSV